MNETFEKKINLSSKQQKASKHVLTYQPKYTWFDSRQKADRDTTRAVLAKKRNTARTMILTSALRLHDLLARKVKIDDNEPKDEKERQTREKDATKLSSDAGRLLLITLVA